jgi:hypothetical protein
MVEYDAVLERTLHRNKVTLIKRKRMQTTSQYPKIA